MKHQGKGITIGRRDFLLLSALVLGGCAGQGTSSGSATSTADTASTSSASDGVSATKSLYSYRFADAAEGREFLLSQDEYHDGFSQEDIDYRLQKKGGTIDEYKAFAAEQMMDFTEEDKDLIIKGMADLNAFLTERDLSLPESEEIVFVKSTMAEEGYAGGYTLGTHVYLGDDALSFFASEDEVEHLMSRELLAHELFHCLTRANPDFRKRMYAIINFEVADEDYVFGPNVAERLLSNPDVEHHNSSALFTIGGEQKRCAVVFYATQPFDKEGESFFDASGAGLVPVDDLDTLYDSEEAEDFWDVVGRNTDYVIDPEETMAGNFAFAVVDGPDGMEYESPEIIEAILKELSA